MHKVLLWRKRPLSSVYGCRTIADTSRQTRWPFYEPKSHTLKVSGQAETDVVVNVIHELRVSDRALLAESLTPALIVGPHARDGQLAVFARLPAYVRNRARYRQLQSNR
jgi:hypothetical protein